MVVMTEKHKDSVEKAEHWRGLVQPNVNRGGWLSPTQFPANVNLGQSVPQDVNPGGRLSPTQFPANVYLGQSVPQDVNPGGRLSPTQFPANVNLGQSVPQDVNPGGRLSPTQSDISRKAFQHYNQEVWRIEALKSSVLVAVLSSGLGSCIKLGKAL
ncbi:hypothetical protein Q3G72_012284 [Acer saccharum]|nr:hypothetical protein Q3G72_012284 [Acer saccharum]